MIRRKKHKGADRQLLKIYRKLSKKAPGGKRERKKREGRTVND